MQNRQKEAMLLFLGVLPPEDPEAAQEQKLPVRGVAMELAKQHIFTLNIAPYGMPLTALPWRCGQLTRIHDWQYQEEMGYTVKAEDAELLADSYATGFEILFKKASYPAPLGGQKWGVARLKSFKNFRLDNQEAYLFAYGDETLPLQLTQPKLQEFLQAHPRQAGPLRVILNEQAMHEPVLLLLQRQQKWDKDKQKLVDEWLCPNVFLQQEHGIESLLQRISK